MKTITKTITKTILSLFVFLMLAGCANVAERQSYALLSGKWMRGGPEKIRLYHMVDGEMKELAASVIGPDSSFFLAFRPEREVLCFLGAYRGAVHRYAFWMKKGQSIDITVTADSYTLNGKADAENEALARWHDFMLPIERKSIYFAQEKSVFEEFLPMLDEKLQALPALDFAPTGNRAFDRAFDDYRRLNMTEIAVTYFFAPRRTQPKPAEFTEYYRSLNLDEYTRSQALLAYPAGIDLLQKIIFIRMWSKGEKTANQYGESLALLPQMASDTLRGAFTLKLAASNRTYAGLVNFDREYGKYLITAVQREKMQDMLNSLAVVKEKFPALDFRFPDAEGNEVALSDFKDRVVYIDVWATWCGPCKQELPHLKKLEKELHHNPNVVFLSVAVDASKDIEKWKTFVEREELKGVQLFAGDRAKRELMDPYKITGIPRFILVGKDGNIVSPDAPRPSSQEILPLLSTLSRSWGYTIVIRLLYNSSAEVELLCDCRMFFLN
jgi:thiol-disulfide isomerase/thioredoxin